MQINCKKCLRQIKSLSRSEYCAKCDSFFHDQCIYYEQLPFICNNCMSTALPFMSIEDDDFLEIIHPTYYNQLNLKHNYILNNLNNISNHLLSNDPDILFPNSHSPYINHEQFLKDNEKNKSDDLSLFHMNTVSLYKKIDEIRELTSSLKNPLKCIGISETRLTHNSILNVDIPNYNFYHKPSNTSAGGVGMYIHNSINATIRHDLNLNIDKVEDLWFELLNHHDKNKNIIIAIIYRHPSYLINDLNSFINAMRNNLSKITSSNTTAFIMGDINLNLLIHDKHKEINEYLNTMYDNFFHPLITNPTRLPTNPNKTPSLLDHIFTNSNNNNIKSCIPLLHISDHLPVSAVLPNLSDKKNKPKTKKRYWKDINKNAFITDLNIKLNNFIPHNLNNDVNSSFDKFQNIFLEILNNHAPLREISNREYRLSLHPWINKSLLKSIKKKQKMYITHFLGNNDSKILYYKNYCNILSKVKCKLKQDYFKRKFDQQKSDVKGTWRVINQIIKIKSTKKSNFSLNINNQLSTDPAQISTHFNNFFSNVGKNLVEQIPPSSKMFSNYLHNPIDKKFKFEPTTQIEIYEIISNLKNSSSCGIDNIPTKIIKEAASSICTPLEFIFNKSLQDGIFPNAMKTAKIIPIYKSGDNTNVNNYRPISLLTIFSKILEKLAFSRLMKFITDNNILCEDQFGFRKNNSTNLALLEFTDSIHHHLDNNRYVGTLFLDLSKAFDSVDLDILLNKLKYYGITSHTHIHNWFSSYLLNRNQIVEINQFHSHSNTVTHGVPQGSVLGPLLFLLYINDLVKSSSLLNFRLFADDTLLFLADSNLETLQSNMNTELDHVMEWMRANKLTINVTKTKAMVFHSNKKSIPQDFTFTLGTTSIPYVKSTKYLGLTFDDRLSWSFHLNNIKIKLSKSLGALFKIRNYCPPPVLRNIYFSLIYPFLLYGILCWGCSSDSKLKPLQTTQNKILRCMTFSAHDSHANPLYKQLNLLKIKDIFYQQCSLFMFKYHNSLLPNKFNNYFISMSNIHNYNTRQVYNNYFPIRYKTNFGLYSPSSFCRHIWNLYTPEMKDLPLQTFKYEVSTLLRLDYD